MQVTPQSCVSPSTLHQHPLPLFDMDDCCFLNLLKSVTYMLLQERCPSYSSSPLATPLVCKLLLHWNASAIADLRNHMVRRSHFTENCSHAACSGSWIWNLRLLTQRRPLFPLNFTAALAELHPRWPIRGGCPQTAVLHTATL